MVGGGQMWSSCKNTCCCTCRCTVELCSGFIPAASVAPCGFVKCSACGGSPALCATQIPPSLF